MEITMLEWSRKFRKVIEQVFEEGRVYIEKFFVFDVFFDVLLCRPGVGTGE